MARYTLELRQVLDYYGDSFMGDYPIFDETHREHLNELIKDHYIMHEIAHETADMFMHRFKTHMRLNMPAFNQLYETQRIKINPLITMDIETTGETVNTGKSKSLQNSESSNSGESEGLSVSYQFPQTRLAGNKDYASAAADSQEVNSSSNNATAVSESDSDSHGTNKGRQVGYAGIPSDLINAFRSSIINVDEMILDSLAGLFLNIWTPNPRGN